MTDIERETYKVNRKTGVVHTALAGRLTERCNEDDSKYLVEVMSIEDIGSVTRRKVRFCRWCAPDMPQ